MLRSTFETAEMAVGKYFTRISEEERKIGDLAVLVDAQCKLYAPNLYNFPNRAQIKET